MLTGVLPRRVLELAIGLSCACLPSANLLFEKTVHSFRFPSLRGHRNNNNNNANGDSSQTAVPGGVGGGRKPSTATTSSHWSSIVSKITVRTVNLTARGSYDISFGTSRAGGRNNNHYGDDDYDAEYGGRRTPMVVMFNNPLNVPSIRSMSSEDRSRRSLRLERDLDLTPGGTRTTVEGRSRSSSRGPLGEENRRRASSSNSFHMGERSSSRRSSSSRFRMQMREEEEEEEDREYSTMSQESGISSQDALSQGKRMPLDQDEGLDVIASRGEWERGDCFLTERVER